MEIQGTVQLSGTADVTYRAKNKITIKPGFRAYEGVKMRAGIDADLDGYTDNGDRDGDGIPDEYENEFAALNPDNSTDAANIDPTFNLPWYEVYHLNLRHEGISPGSLSGPAPTVNALLADFGPDFGTFVGTDTGDRNGDGILDFWETQSDSSLDGFYCALFVADPPYDYRVSSAGIWVSSVIPGDGESHFPSWWDLHGATSTTFDIVRFGKPSAPWVGESYLAFDASNVKNIPFIPEVTTTFPDGKDVTVLVSATDPNKLYGIEIIHKIDIEPIDVGPLKIGTGGTLIFNEIFVEKISDDENPIIQLYEIDFGNIPVIPLPQWMLDKLCATSAGKALVDQIRIQQIPIYISNKYNRRTRGRGGLHVPDSSSQSSSILLNNNPSILKAELMKREGYTGTDATIDNLVLVSLKHEIIHVDQAKARNYANITKRENLINEAKARREADEWAVSAGLKRLYNVDKNGDGVLDLDDYIHIVLENDIEDQDGDGDIDMNDYDIISQSSSQGSNQVGHSTGYSKKAQQNMWNEIKTLTKDKKVFKNESWNCN